MRKSNNLSKNKQEASVTGVKCSLYGELFSSYRFYKANGKEPDETKRSN